MTAITLTAAGPDRSVFAGADICREAGLTLPSGTRRPVFEDDLWDFTAVAGLPNQMSKVSRRFNFTAIASVCWRLVAREQIMAMIAPRLEAVMTLPDPAAPAHRVRAARRADPVPELAHPPGRHQPRRPRHQPLRGIPGPPALPARR